MQTRSMTNNTIKLPIEMVVYVLRNRTVASKNINNISNKNATFETDKNTIKHSYNLRSRKCVGFCDDCDCNIFRKK